MSTDTNHCRQNPVHNLFYERPEILIQEVLRMPTDPNSRGFKHAHGFGHNQEVLLMPADSNSRSFMNADGSTYTKFDECPHTRIHEVLLMPTDLNSRRLINVHGSKFTKF